MSHRIATVLLLGKCFKFQVDYGGQNTCLMADSMWYPLVNLADQLTISTAIFNSKLSIITSKPKATSPKAITSRRFLATFLTRGFERVTVRQLSGKPVTGPLPLSIHYVNHSFAATDKSIDSYSKHILVFLFPDLVQC